MFPKIIWFINRLRCMSVPEVLHRVRVLAITSLEKRGLLLASPAAPDFGQTGQFWVSINTGQPEVSDVQWEKLQAGQIKVFALEDYELGQPPVWNRDPKTGTQSPLAFGKTLDYRSEAIVGDIKYLWEPSRHLHIVALAQYYANTKQPECLKNIQTQLESWIDQCPYMQGAHWTSSLELGIRLINWSIVWQLMGGLDSPLFKDKQGEAFKQQWLTCIYQHIHFIKGHYSRFSSANNHLIGEAAGVFIGAETWPYWPELKRWGKEAGSILEQEALSQNHSDGVNKEQAISYQQFVLDFLLLPLLSAKANGGTFSADYQRCIESMMDYMATMMDSKGNMPMIGDADDGYAVILDHSRPFCPYRSLLATGAVLFNRADFKAKAAGFDAKSFALLGPEGLAAYQALKPSAQFSHNNAFTEGGYYILADKQGQAGEVRMMVDAGPLGYGGIAAHGHADALAVYLAVAGREFLIDPGTYAYHTEQKWRNYFRGTSAHNTLRIDGLDQSEIGGNFMWLRKAEATVQCFEDSEDLCVFEGSHDGYKVLPDPVDHSRRIIFDKKSQVFEIEDKITARNSHITEQYWHLSESIQVECLSDNRFILTNGPVQVQMDIDSRLTVELITGDEALPLGWVSRSFDIKVPATTIVARSDALASCCLQTMLQVVANVSV